MLIATGMKSYGVSSSIATSLWFGERHLLMWRREKASRDRHKKTGREHGRA
jgi:hypothetical protein